MTTDESAKKLAKDLSHFGLDIPYAAAVRMIEAGWNYNPEKDSLLQPVDVRRVISLSLTDNPLPDMRVNLMNRMRNEH